MTVCDKLVAHKILSFYYCHSILEFEKNICCPTIHLLRRRIVFTALHTTFGLCVRRGIRIRPARYKCRLKILNTIYNKMLINERPAPTEFE